MEEEDVFDFREEAESSPEVELEQVLRPKKFNDFSGQDKVTENRFSVTLSWPLKSLNFFGRKTCSNSTSGELSASSRKSNTSSSSIGDC